MQNIYLTILEVEKRLKSTLCLFIKVNEAYKKVFHLNLISGKRFHRFLSAIIFERKPSQVFLFPIRLLHLILIGPFSWLQTLVCPVALADFLLGFILLYLVTFHYTQQPHDTVSHCTIILSCDVINPARLKHALQIMRTQTPNSECIPHFTVYISLLSSIRPINIHISNECWAAVLSDQTIQAQPVTKVSFCDRLTQPAGKGGKQCRLCVSWTKLDLCETRLMFIYGFDGI